MKKAVVTLLAAVLLGTLSPGLAALARPDKIPHEDPATARESGIEDDLLLTYSDVIDLAAAGRYRSAVDSVQELRRASVPPDIAAVIDEYTALYQRLFTELDHLEQKLNETSGLLARNQTGDARRQLSEVDDAIREADSLVKETRSATAGLEIKVSALSGLLPGDPLAQAYDRLQQDVGRLDDIVAGFNKIKQELNGRYTRLAGLMPVELSLDIAPDQAFVGDMVTASGWLGSRSRPLPGRTVAVTTGNRTLATAVTAADGSYRVPFAVPYLYTASIVITAIFDPTRPDTAIYLGEESRPVTFTPGYYKTRLTVSPPDTVYPGLPFNLDGEIGPGGPAREIIVSLGGETLADTVLLAGGRFSLGMTPPPGLPTGRRELRARVAPLGRYAGASTAREVDVAIMDIVVSADAPSLVFLPGTIGISGTAANGPAPVADAPFELRLDRWRVTGTTAPDGTFRAEVPLHALPPAAPLAGNPFYVSAGSTTTPCNLLPLGWQDLEITVEAPGSAPGGFVIKKRIVSVNPMTTTLLLGAAAAAWWFAYRRQRQVGPAATAPALGEVPAPIVPAPPPAPAPILTGIRGRVMAAYRSGQAAVARITGCIMGPDTTLREFLGAAPLPPEVRDRFARLTRITENTLYSPQAPRRAAAVRAEKLAQNIREDLNRGAA
jgi:hypothetical protein